MESNRFSVYVDVMCETLAARLCFDFMEKSAS